MKRLTRGLNMEPRNTNLFRFVDYIDKARWNSIYIDDNYYTPNFFKKNLDDDTILLTHWLCYITDRQMDFRRCWDVGGYIFSKLVQTWKTNETNIETLLNLNGEESFLKSGKQLLQMLVIANERPLYKINDDSLYLVSHTENNEDNAILERWGFNNSIVYFSSRFMSDDIQSVFRTFIILETLELQFADFLYQKAMTFKDHSKGLWHYFDWLYVLSYYHIRKYAKTFGTPGDFVIGRIEDIKNNCDIEVCYKALPDSDDRLFKSKRLWCALRDYLKSMFYNEKLRSLFEQFDKKNDDKFVNLIWDGNKVKTSILGQLQLPGDTWNNNDAFVRCLFQDHISNASLKLNKQLYCLINEMQHSSEETDYYPEQFDFSFDFVPRMCDRNNCKVCPLGLLSLESQTCGSKNKGLYFNRVCIAPKKDDGKSTKLCSVLLVSCGYSFTCNPDCCVFFQLNNEINADNKGSLLN